MNAPSASLVVYEAPNTNDADALDLFQRIASDDSAQVVTTSWGNCEQVVGASDINAENAIFRQMAAQGQTMLAASGDSGSEDCFPDDPGNTGLAIDDPGSQPDVVSVGATSLTQRVSRRTVGLEQLPERCPQLCCSGKASAPPAVATPPCGHGNPGQPTASGPTPIPATAARAGAVPFPTSRTRAIPRAERWSPIGTADGRLSEAPASIPRPPPVT